MQRATSQRIDANLANQRSRNPSEVIVGAVRRSRESLRARGRPRVLRQHFQRELPQRRVSKGRHAAPRPHASVDESLVDIDVACSAMLLNRAVCRPAGSRRLVGLRSLKCAYARSPRTMRPR